MTTPSAEGCPPFHCPAEDKKHFVDQHKEELIQCIFNVEAILSQLLQDRLLISEEYEAVKTQTTSQERMSHLFSFIQDWSTSKKDQFLQALKCTDPAAVCDMEKMLDPGTNKEIEKRIKEYRQDVKYHFELMKDRNSGLGERILLRKRYTKLVLLRKFRDEEERKRELISSGEEQIQILIERSSEQYSPTSLEELLDPDDKGIVPKTVVLHGPSGIGKSLTAHKIILDWATANLFTDKFNFLFYISYKDFKKITEDISLAGLLSQTCRVNYPTEIMRAILSKSEKLGFMINSFEELHFEETLKDKNNICDPFKVTHKDILLRSLLKGDLLTGASLIITTRSFALEKLQAMLPDRPRFVEIVGYMGKARESYIQTYFGRNEATEMALNILKKNEALFTMCTVPFMCWVISTVTKQQITKYPSNFVTDTSMFLYYLKGLIKYHSRNNVVISSLKKVCALANEGVLNQKFLFEEEDLRRHKLSVSLVESVFLNKIFFGVDIETSSCYSFIHRSFQEFLAVVYYALPGEGDSAGNVTSCTKVVIESTYLPDICKGRSLTDLLEKHPHLALPVRFLFGLLNQQQNKDFTKTSGCSLSFRGTTAMIKWLFEGEISTFDTEHLHLLYETRNDEFVQNVVSRAVDLTFTQCQRPDNWIYQLAFCLKACAGRKVTLFGYALKRDDLEVLIPLLKKCPQVCFRGCRFADDVHSTSWRKSMFTLLVSQDSTIAELCLLSCILPSSTCEVLDNASKQSPCLYTLNVMFKVDTKEEHEEMRHYFEAFKSPDSTMSTRKMMGKTWFMLRSKRERIPFYQMERHRRWDMFEPEEFPFHYRSEILFSRRRL